MTVLLLMSRLNRMVAYRLEKDLKDKFAALTIDQQNLELRNAASGGLKINPSAVKISNK